MEIENLLKFEYVLAFATFILPGFIIMKIMKLKFPNKDFLLKDVLFEALSYSLLNISIFGWIPYLLSYYNHTVLSIIAYIIVLIITPIFLSLIYIKIISKNFFGKNFDIPISSAWDWYFGKRQKCILLVKLKDGKEIIGYFGVNSYATSYPNEGSIYIEALYKKDDVTGSLNLIPNTKGILIHKDQYSTIEFYNIGE